MARQYKKAATIKKEAFDAEKTVMGADVKEAAREKRFDEIEKGNFIEDIAEICDSQFFHMNYHIHDFKKVSKEPVDWCVYRFYPTAKDEEGKLSPAYIDYPRNERQLSVCREKAKIMQKKGLRYFIYRPQEELKFEQLMQAMRGE